MKAKLILLLVALLAFLPTAWSQKYACINTDYVLRSIPDYNNAVKRLDKYVQDWQNELQEKNSELEAMRTEYEQESYLLPENLKKRRQEEIKEKEQEVKALQQQRFGAGGDLDKKRAELLKPVQDRVYSTIERIANEKNYAFVFDKAGNNAVLFANKKFDISDDVLELMGYKPGAAEPPKEAAEKPQRKPTNPEMNTGARGKSREVTPPLGVTPR
jgi:outer membrane protein